ncbi:MAG TPA: SDR family oxidoreductase [Geminicoccus sp.]|jgi:NAD(P)-dependent dehydrogenase (short-subunit alcohol dehydrogenase family)|uniref:SDR family NAD(P)-dependent oxidoreductase n=1 Tax=Geminicoccus sp. TaxID=2024832 RepID=UPI002E309CE2|nr:SDR family oxidoreductase [Geminicoccus sp.]HEX2524935.1 SDR family oxidoreductase [Geminicoccus sp.]
MSGWAIYPSLKGKSVFISGGGSGIGAAITEAFAQQGAKVAFCDLSEDCSQELVERLGAEGHDKVHFEKADVRDIDQLKGTIANAAAANGPITILVNNAARDDRHAFDTVTPEYWDERFAVNLKHQFFASQAVFPMMKEAGGGSIVNFGSTSWMVGQGGMPAYTSAKSAVAGLTRSLARDFGPFNIRVNAIAPGWIMTERQKSLWLTPEGIEELMKRQCLKRQLQPVEMARLTLFLASEDSSAMTNQTYIADGGWV